MREGALIVDATGAILAVGPRRDLIADHPGATEERGEGALLPALVNAHTHLELSLLAGQIPGGDGIVPWATALMPKLASRSLQDKQAAATVAAAEARAAGTAAVGDVANTLDAVPALADAGLRGVVFHELVGSREARTGDAIADAAREREAFLARHPWPQGVRYALAPHAPYSADPGLLRRIFAAATAAGEPTTMHVAEDPDELTLLRDGTGRWPAILHAIGVAAGSRTPGQSPVAYLADLGAFAPGCLPPLLVHMVHATDQDLALTREVGASVVLCPRSNRHIGGKLPRLDAILAAEIPIALGTDSLASSPSLSLWGEIAVLAEAFPDVDAHVWLAAATRGGAEALHLSALGSLVVGKRPGILDVAVDAAITPSTAPSRSLVTNPQPRLRWMASA
jgi:cytosine/adenosine deaminase-related metal-dependent hydrolase